MPSPGRITHLSLPQGPYVRVDTHIYDGYQIPSEYDSMIAKIITWGATREVAMDRLRRALSEMEIGGIATTARFHEAVVTNEQFRSGNFDTDFIVKESENLQAAMEHASEGGTDHGSSCCIDCSEASFGGSQKLCKITRSLV